MASRRTQPYRRGQARSLGQALNAMTAGKPAFMANPQDSVRAMQKKHRKRHPAKRHGRLAQNLMR